jgi:hypothetical protein
VCDGARFQSIETVADVVALLVALPGLTVPKVTAEIGLIVIDEFTVALSAIVALFEVVAPKPKLEIATTNPKTQADRLISISCSLSCRVLRLFSFWGSV